MLSILTAVVAWFVPWRARAASPEIRATWITTSGNDDWSTANIGTTMSSLKQVGLNTVYVQAWKNGYTNFTSGSLAAFTGVSSTNSSITSPTLLADAKSAAAASGLVMGAWFEYGLMAQFTGNTGTTTSSFNALAQKCRDATWTLTSGTSTVSGTGWLLRDSSGNYTTASNGFVWMNPLVPEVRNLIKGIAIDAVKQFDLQIVQFDDHLAWPQAFGWDSYTLTAYKQETGRGTPATTTDANFLAWRQGKTQAFFAEVSDAIKAVKPSVLVSLAPSVIATSSSSYCADWSQWMTKTDEVLPQVYRSTISAFNTDWPLQITAAGTNSAELGAGLRLLGTGSATPWTDLQQQIDRTRTDGALGHSIWFSDGISNSGTNNTSNYNSQLTAYYNVATNGIAANPFFQTVRWSGTGGNGGSGTWSQLDSQWKDRSTIWVSSAEGIFDGVGGTVTVSGSVMSESGLDFRTTGYTVTGGTLAMRGVFRTDNHVAVASGATATIASVLTGSTGLTKTGTGTLAITGTATGLTGGIQIDAGTLRIGSGGTTGLLATSNTISIASGGTVAFNRSDDYGGAITNVISGSGGLSLLSGSLALSGSNSYGGGTTLSGGTLQAGHASALGSSSSTLNVSAGTLNTGTFSLSLGALSGGTAGIITTATTAGTRTFTTSVNTGTSTYAGRLQSNGAGELSLVKTGSGTLVLSGSNAGMGAMTVSAGTLQIGDGGTLGTLGSGTVTNNGTLVFNRSDAYGGAVANVIAGSGGLSLLSGSLALSGSNSYGGGTTLSGGTLQAGHASALGSSSSTLNVSAGTLNTGTFSLSLGALSGGTAGIITTATTAGTRTFTTAVNTGTSIFAGRLQSNGAGELALVKTGSGTLVLSGSNAGMGAMTVSAGTLQIGDGGTGGTLGSGTVTNNGAIVFNRSDAYGGAVANVITGSGGLSLLSGSLALSGSNSYGGGTTLTGGTLQAGHASALGSSSSTLNVSAGTLNTGTFSLSLGALSGGTAGIITTASTAGTRTFTTAVNTGTSTYAGRLQSNGAGELALVKTGSGTLVLSGSNAGMKAMTVSAGTLQIGDGGTGGTLGSGTVTNNGAIVFNRSDAYGGAVANALTGTGGITIMGGTLTLTGSNGCTGGTVLTGGMLALGSANALGSSGTISFGGGVLQFSGSNTTDYSTRFSTSGSQAFKFDTNGQNVSFASALQGTGGTLTKQGAGALVLTGSNTYTGATTVSGGTLGIGAGGTTGSLASDIVNNAAVTFNRSDALTYANAISGTGTLTKQGAGALVLTGSNTYTGATTVSGGTLAIGAGGTTGSLASDIVNNAAVTFNRSDALTYANAISGTGTLAKQGGGALVLAGSNSYTGGTTLSGGTLQTGHASALGSSSSTLNVSAGTLNTGTFSLALGALSGGTAGIITTATTAGTRTFTTAVNTGTSIFAGRLQSNGAGELALVKTGSGTLVLSGSNAGMKAMTVSAGTLQIGDGGTGGTLGSGTVTNNGAIVFNRSDAYGGAVANVLTGTGGITIMGGTLTLSAANTFTGQATASAGMVVLSNTVALQSATLNASGGAVAFSGTAGSQFVVGGLTGTGNIALRTTGSSALTLRVGGNGSTQTYTGTLSGIGGLAKTGTGTLTLAANNTFTGPTTVSAGTLKLGAAAALASSTVNVAAGATLALGPLVEATVPALANSGLVDTGRGRLTVAAGLSEATLVNQVTAGIVNGGTTGITSSDAAATGGAFTVGWLDNGGGSFTFGYAAAGDTNLDNFVDLTDLLNTVGGGYYDSGTTANWAQGDFNYDGLNDLTDLLSLVGGGLYDGPDYFSAPPPLLLFSLDSGSGGADALAAVPEPGSGILAVSALLLAPLLWARRSRYHARSTHEGDASNET